MGRRLGRTRTSTPPCAPQQVIVGWGQLAGGATGLLGANEPGGALVPGLAGPVLQLQTPSPPLEPDAGRGPAKLLQLQAPSPPLGPAAAQGPDKPVALPPEEEVPRQANASGSTDSIGSQRQAGAGTLPELRQQAAPESGLPKEDSNQSGAESDGTTYDSDARNDGPYRSADSNGSSNSYSPPVTVRGSSTPPTSSANRDVKGVAATAEGHATSREDGPAASQDCQSDPLAGRTGPGAGPSSGTSGSRPSSRAFATYADDVFDNPINVNVVGGGNPSTSQARACIDSMQNFYRDKVAATAAAVVAAAARAASITNKELFGITRQG